MPAFFKNENLTNAVGLNMLGKNDYSDIHQATLQVLEKTGIFVEDQQAREVFGSCGALVDSKNKIVKLSSRIVEDAIRSAPAQVVLAGLNPDCDILLENNGNAYLNFGGGINVVDPYTGIVRQSTKADLAASARLCDALTEVSVYSRAGFSTMIASMAMAGAGLLVGIGGLETGLTFDFGQAVLDDEIVRMIKHLKQGIEVNAETLSVDLIHEIGPSGEFLSHDSTLSKMKSLSQTHLFDRNNREDWENKGKPGSYAKALSRAIDILENHQPEPLPQSAARQVQAILEEAEKEVGGK